MPFAEMVIAIQQLELGLGILIAVLLAVGLLVPYLVKEIRRGKAEAPDRDPDRHR